MLIILWYLLLT
jgi:hypothetical protein